MNFHYGSSKYEVVSLIYLNHTKNTVKMYWLPRASSKRLLQEALHRTGLFNLPSRICKLRVGPH